MNSTANGSSESSSCFTQLNSTAWKIGSTVSYCLFIIVSLAANSLIVMIVYKTPNLRKPINYFIANMASSDLLFPIFWIPWRLSYLHTNSFLIGGKLGQALCKLIPFLANVSIVVSIQNLILIAVDRFGAVVFPLRSPLIRSKLCPFFILSTWIVAVAVNSPYLFTFELVEYPEETWCRLERKKAFGEFSSFASYRLAFYILFLFIPVLLLVILYSTIVIKLKTKAHPGEQSANSQQQRNKRNRNVFQMSIAIVTVFLLCWLPSSINELIIQYQYTFTHFSCSFWIYYHVTFYMTCAYCAVNPIICFMFSSNYRKALKRLIKCSFVQA
ncbi:RYamide receptor-like [Porites lutea]|uniref:RYamide receptor-like n=1 Tax=Porites lutea TaxID=51062 RepID=UPI003CC5FF3D